MRHLSVMCLCIAIVLFHKSLAKKSNKEDKEKPKKNLVESEKGIWKSLYIYTILYF